MNQDKSVSDLLEEYGITHKATARTATDLQHDIIYKGEKLGRLTAFMSVDLLAKLDEGETPTPELVQSVKMEYYDKMFVGSSVR